MTKGSEPRMWPTWHLRTALPDKTTSLIAAVRCTLDAFLTSAAKQDVVTEDYSIIKTTEVLLLPKILTALSIHDAPDDYQDIVLPRVTTRQMMRNLYLTMYTDDSRFETDNNLSNNYETFSTLPSSIPETSSRIFEIRFRRRLNMLAMNLPPDLE